MPKYTIPAEISWLSFNDCILEDAQENNNPLYERVKFLAIHSSTVGEFFRVKISKLLRGNSENNCDVFFSFLGRNSATDCR